MVRQSKDNVQDAQALADRLVQLPADVLLSLSMAMDMAQMITQARADRPA